MKIAVVYGSKSDEEYLSSLFETLITEKIDYDKFILSAHRNAKETMEFAKKAEKKGYNLIIAAAGYAAHLPGFIASFSKLPVIGIPVPSSPFKGIDSLLSIIQMPGGVPVVSTGIGKGAPKNAALFVKRIINIINK